MNYGRYQIIKEVGRGSMGVVYQCRDPHIDRLVAVKVLRTDRVESENFVQRFLKEAKVIGRLAHPGIVTIYDVGEEQGTVYIAMEYLEGTALSDVMKANLPPLHDLVGLGVQLAEALDYAHQKGVVHRDVKPSNIVVQPDGQIKITDFGIAHVDDATATLQTQAGEIMGTPAYMSPEQVLSQPVDARSDIFSLGIILYELAAGRRPFGGENRNIATVFKEVVELTPPEPVSVAPAIPAELSRIIMKALNKERDQRFQSGKEMVEALKGVLAAPASAAAPLRPLPTAPRETNPKVTPGERKPASRYAVAAAAIVAAVAILGGGAYFLTSDGSRGETAAISGSKTGGSAPDAAAPRIPDAAQPAPAAPLDAAPSVPVSSPTTATPYVPAAPPGGGAASVPSSYQPVRATGSAPASASPLRGYLAPKPDGPLPRKEPKPVAAAVPAPEKKSLNPGKVQAKAQAEREPLRKPKQKRRVDAVPPVASTTSAGGPDPAAAAMSAAKIAFLNVATTPPGARIYINGEAKGTTPRIVKLNLGQYRVRLARPGYQEIERRVSLDQVKEYPVTEVLTREE